MPDESTQQLIDAIRDNFTPEAVALIATKLQVSYSSSRSNEQTVEAEEQCQWFMALLIEMLGTDQYNAFIEELGL